MSCFRWPQWFLALSLGLYAAAGSALDLELATVRLKGGEVSFHTSGSEPVSSLPPIEGENIEAASTQHYSVYVNLDEINLSKYGYFHYQFYVKPKPGGDGALSKYIVQGEPVGAFLAQAADADIYITDSSGRIEQTKISLPVFSLETPAYLSFVPRQKPEEVEIGGETEIPIRLQNLLERWPVSIVSAQQSNMKKVWMKADLLVKGSSEFRPFDVQPSSVAEDSLVLRLVPNSGRALVKAFSREARGAQERVTVYLNYRTHWGIERTLEVNVPIRFVPWPPFLFLSVIIGTLLGSLVPVVAGQKPRGQWLQAFVASLLTAILAELIAMLLVQHDSAFRLLGFDLDPFQLLPAAIIGALLGLLGFASLDAMRRLIPNLRGETVTPEPSAGEPENASKERRR